VTPGVDRRRCLLDRVDHRGPLDVVFLRSQQAFIEQFLQLAQPDSRVSCRLRGRARGNSGDPDILVVFDAGYDVTRLAWLLADLPAELLGRLRSDRVLYFPAPPRPPGALGRPSRHGPELKLAEPGTWPGPPVTTVTQTTRYGTAAARSRDRLHPRLTSRAAWQEHDGELPVIEGTLIRLQVDYLPGDRDPKPVWAVVVPHRRRPRRRGQVLAGVLAPVRHRAHVPPVQAGPRLDRAEDLRPGRRGPLDLVDHRLPRPAPPRPAAGRRLAPPLGAPRLAGPAHPGQGAAGFPEHPRDDRLSRRHTESRQARARTAAWIEEPPSSRPSRRRQAPQGEHSEQRNRLNGKLSGHAIYKGNTSGAHRSWLHLGSGHDQLAWRTGCGCPASTA
jgi:hypothetical protein